ncbi:Ig-like domain-containing protein [Rhodococcus sp. IEGM 1379]|uniref:Ig-like domain-containing protein n=1 Tax=Rhodococcus sp. IEGM 1379 TaxID=3047086 RepID=UPI0024B812B5|nr:Ig-like domain-containing protein [Rhodococcus sp. IEGM 1379]MDI9917161.1 Ig-like domain-containing protein [Rhodococcus sp. IEGM 1379]
MSRFFPVGGGRVARLPRRTAAVFTALPAALLLAASGALLAPSLASAAPGDDITDTCLQMSQNGGAWVAPSAFGPVGTGYIPVPGDSGTVLTFDVRNICDVPATLTLFSQGWSVTDGGTATVQGQIGSQKGQQVQIGPGVNSATRIELAKKPVTTNVGVQVGFILGIPGGEVVQGNQIDGGWNLELIEDEPVVVVAPAAPTGLTLDAAEVETGTPVTVSGTAEPGSTVTVTGGGKSCTATADTNGNFSCQLTITEVGSHPITATASNAGGTGPASTPVTVTVAAEPTDPGGSSGSSTGSLGSLDVFGSFGS